MARDFDSRLERLKARRMGPPDVQKVRKNDAGFSVPLEEAFQKRGAKTASTYALGAMQQVDPAYTAKSFDEGERVRNQLAKALAGEIPVEFDYQGSVPLDIHIKGVSDIDLLLLRTVYVVLDTTGARASTHYFEWDGPPGPTLLQQLRNRAEQILANAFPEATVDISGSKAITISGGSLRREVDVIPSHWYDTAAYQASLLKKDRGIYIFLKKENDRMLNYPFLHMHEIQVKDDSTIGGTKKVIRLLKTLVADYEGPAPIELSSYDVASLVWHFGTAGLIVPTYNELSLLWITKANLDSMVFNEHATRNLDTPDRTRKIIDKESKFSGLVQLRDEVDDLVREVAIELSGIVSFSNDDLSRVLRESQVAPAPAW